jgi:hypothetical protein
MSEDENVLARWSRLKRERARRDGEEITTEKPNISEPLERRDDATDNDTSAAFDPTSLPPLESIVAGSDIRAFLQTGVPAELARAALRRAWSNDPSIRDFIEMAENQWDFVNPGTIPGFGPLTGADDIPGLVAKALGEGRHDQEPIAEGYHDEGSTPHLSEERAQDVAAGVKSTHAADFDTASSREGDSEPLSDCETARAPQQGDGGTADAPPMPARVRRSHGSALPS